MTLLAVLTVYFTLLHLVQVDSTGVQMILGNFLESTWSPPEIYLNSYISTKYTWTPDELQMNFIWSPTELDSLKLKMNKKYI